MFLRSFYIYSIKFSRFRQKKKHLKLSNTEEEEEKNVESAITLAREKNLFFFSSFFSSQTNKTFSRLYLTPQNANI